jgi:hypothetical protein
MIHGKYQGESSDEASRFRAAPKCFKHMLERDDWKREKIGSAST